VLAQHARLNALGRCVDEGAKLMQLYSL